MPLARAKYTVPAGLVPSVTDLGMAPCANAPEPSAPAARVTTRASASDVRRIVLLDGDWMRFYSTAAPSGRGHHRRRSPILRSKEPALSATVEPERSLITVTHVIYGLHAASLITGIVTTASIVFAFLTGWPSIIAVILNYVKRGEARGTVLEPHFRWQIRTFWWGLLWGALCLAFVVATLGIGVLIAWFPLMGVGFWFIYRIAKGWLRLVDRKAMDGGGGPHPAIGR